MKIYFFVEQRPWCEMKRKAFILSCESFLFFRHLNSTRISMNISFINRIESFQSDYDFSNFIEQRRDAANGHKSQDGCVSVKRIKRESKVNEPCRKPELGARGRKQMPNLCWSRCVLGPGLSDQMMINDEFANEAILMISSTHFSILLRQRARVIRQMNFVLQHLGLVFNFK